MNAIVLGLDVAENAVVETVKMENKLRYMKLICDLMIHISQQEFIIIYKWYLIQFMSYHPNKRLKKDTGSGVINRSSFSSPKNLSTISEYAPAAGLSSPRVITGVPKFVHVRTSLDSGTTPTTFKPNNSSISTSDNDSSAAACIVCCLTMKFL